MSGKQQNYHLASLQDSLSHSSTVIYFPPTSTASIDLDLFVDRRKKNKEIQLKCFDKKSLE